MLLQIALAVFSAAFLAAVAIYLLFSEKLGKRHRAVRKRLEGLSAETPVEGEAFYPILRDDKLSGIPAMNRILSRFRFSQNLQRLIDQAGLPMKAGVLILGMLSLGGLIFLLVLSLLDSILLALAAGLAATSLPYIYVRRRKTTRQRDFESLLPEAIDLITNALKSGFSLESSLSMVSKEIPDPVGIEFAIAFEEQNLGVGLTDALSNMEKRVESEDLGLFTTALTIQKKTGGNLVEILEKIGSTIRERFQLKRQVRVYTAQGRLSGFVLVLLPIVTAIVLLAINPEYLKILLVERAGNFLLGGAIIMQILGVWVIRRIVDIRV
ncbi:MAG: type II secretion system F family protein [Candidatus Zixiibacteriota bacterium]|nr:MAG: type II secretion system F family protein [candidate division Zixibacteria bacterium]